jgi:hypothetical protein
VGSTKAEIAADRHPSGRFQALMRISAWNNDDMREWFHLVSATLAEPDPPTCRAFSKKRLKGFEPSTFCMAIMPGYAALRECGDLQGLRTGAAEGADLGYARICDDTRRFGALVRASARKSRWWFDSAFSD